MREGRPLYYLPDQDYGPRDAISVPFFGVLAATIPGLSRIARVARAKVLPCVTRMLPGGTGYELRIEPPWDNFPTDDLAADTRRMNTYIEKRIADMPEQYNWMHRRFRPPAGKRVSTGKALPAHGELASRLSAPLRPGRFQKNSPQRRGEAGGDRD
jgi:KDO2-lipid IV(A) lauroyltransferase